MSTLALADPPSLGAKAKYQAFKPWLEAAFYKGHCAYCLQVHAAVTIDHYLPQNFAPEREHDPRNLLLACWNCQPKKSDYHPAHRRRRRLPRDATGFQVLDVRVDNIAK